jgi:hypothetical protein
MIHQIDSKEETFYAEEEAEQLTPEVPPEKVNIDLNFIEL